MGRCLSREEVVMKCVICKCAATRAGQTTETYDLGRSGLVIVRGIPALVCTQCGEAYTDSATMRQLQQIVEKARDNGAVVIRDYRAA
jgi:YgiT-type zinc finger domain-containing protein